MTPREKLIDIHQRFEILLSSDDGKLEVPHPRAIAPTTPGVPASVPIALERKQKLMHELIQTLLEMPIPEVSVLGNAINKKDFRESVLNELEDPSHNDMVVGTCLLRHYAVKVPFGEIATPIWDDLAEKWRPVFMEI